jgi:hypothetical protein
MAFILFFGGLILTMFGVGGVENSVSDPDLGLSTLVAVVGLIVMWTGTRLINQEE